MVDRYRPIPSQKRVLEEALARENFEDWLKRREGLIWTEADTEEVMRIFRSVDRLAEALVQKARADADAAMLKSHPIAYRDIDSLHMGANEQE